MLAKVHNLNAQSYTFVQARTNGSYLASPSNFLFTSLIPGTNMFLVPTNFGDGWGLILNASGGTGGGNLTTNEFQFLGVPLTIIKGAFLTNMNFWSDGTNNGNLWVGGDVLPLTHDTEVLGSVGLVWNAVNLGNGGLSMEEFVGSDVINIVPPSVISATYSLLLPGSQGGNGSTMTNDGSGNLGWWVPVIGGGLTTNVNQFLGVPLSIKQGALFTNITVWTSNNTSIAFTVTNNPGNTLDIVTMLATNGAGLRITSNGAVVVHGVIGSTTNYFEVRNSNNITPIFAVTHSNTVRIVTPNLGAAEAGGIIIDSVPGYTQTPIQFWVGGAISGRWRADSAGNQVISGNGSGDIYFSTEGGSGEVHFQLTTVGTLWTLIPSSAVAAWHGGTVRRGQITNLWDLFVRSNVAWIEVGGSDVVSLQSTSGMSSYTMFLPITNGLAGQLLYNAGGGALGWTNDNSTSIPGLTTNPLQFLGVPLSIIKGAWLTNMNYWEDGTNHGDFYVEGLLDVSGAVSVGGSLTVAFDILPLFNDNSAIGASGNAFLSLYLKSGGLNLLETGVGSDLINIGGPSSLASSYSLILPNAQGATRTTLTNNGSGTMGWYSLDNLYFIYTNLYVFNPNQFQNNDVTNVNIKSGVKLTNAFFEEGSVALTVTQKIGTANNAIEIVSTNKEVTTWINSNSTFYVKGITGRTNDGFAIARTNGVSTLMVRSNDVTVASNVTVYPIGDEVGVMYPLFSMTNSARLTNKTTIASVISNYTGKITLPENFWTRGKIVKLKFRGAYWSAAGTISGTNVVLFGATVLATNLVPLNASAVGDMWESDIDVVCRNTGASGSLYCQGTVTIPSASGGSSGVARRIRWAAGAVTVNTTTSATLDYQYHPNATTTSVLVELGYGFVLPAHGIP